MFVTCASTVRSVTTRRAAIALFDSPSATRPSTPRSRRWGRRPTVPTTRARDQRRPTRLGRCRGRDPATPRARPWPPRSLVQSRQLAECRRQCWRGPTEARTLRRVDAAVLCRAGHARAGGVRRHQRRRCGRGTLVLFRAGRAPRRGAARCRWPAAPPRRSGRPVRWCRSARGRDLPQRSSVLPVGSSRLVSVNRPGLPWAGQKSRPTAPLMAASSSPVSTGRQVTAQEPPAANRVVVRRPGRGPAGRRLRGAGPLE